MGGDATRGTAMGDEGTAERDKTAKAYNVAVKNKLGQPPYRRACELLGERDQGLVSSMAYQVIAVLMVHAHPMRVREIGEAVMGKGFGPLAPKNWASKRLELVGEYAEHDESSGGFLWSLRPSFRDRYPEIVPSLRRADLFSPATDGPDAADMKDAPRARDGETGAPATPASPSEAPAAAGDAGARADTVGGAGTPSVAVSPGGPRDVPPATVGDGTFFGVRVPERDILKAVEIRREGIRDARSGLGHRSTVKYERVTGSGRWQAEVHRLALEEAERGEITPERERELADYEAGAMRDDVIEGLDPRPVDRSRDHLRLDTAPPHVPEPAPESEPAEAAGPSGETAPDTHPEAGPVPDVPATPRPSADGPIPAKRPARMRADHIPGMARPGDGTDQAGTPPQATLEAQEDGMVDRAGQDIDMGKLGFSPGPGMLESGHAMATGIMGSLEARQRERLAKLVKHIIGAERLQAYLDDGLTVEDIEAAFSEHGVSYPQG